MDVQDSLIAALTTQVSSLQGHLATSLGEIRALQAREQARADVPEGIASTVVGPFITTNLLGNALTWWNSHKRAVTQEVAYAMDWKALKKLMTVKYCPRV
ncbi:hypothetical protein Tco_0050591 [Tanacetum coccineum]